MPKLLYLVTENWFFASHFLPMARTARELGFDVVIATQVGAKCRLSDEGFRTIPISSRRGSLSLLDALKYMLQAFKIVRSERPDVVHCIALKPVVLGGVAAKLAGVRSMVLAPTGLGILWLATGFSFRLRRFFVRQAVSYWLAGKRVRYLFENSEDPLEFGLGPGTPNVYVVGGAGVAPDDFPFSPEPPAPPVKVAVVSRMIEPKGIADAVEAVRRARAGGAAVELDLYGEPDNENPLTISEETLRGWSQDPGVQWYGRTDDVGLVWREHHIALFLSKYREGLPRTIIEAAAAGRPIVATDIPGNRELVRDGREGFLVGPGDIDAAAAGISKLAHDATLRQKMGQAANARFHEAFTERAVTNVVAAIYRSLVNPARDRR